MPPAWKNTIEMVYFCAYNHTSDMNTRAKLNALLKLWPRGGVCTTTWLREQGYSHSLIQKYESSDWIRSLGHGAYYRADDEPGWQGAVWALQEQLGLKVHVSGTTALHLHGVSHYLAGAALPLHLTGAPGERLPKWLLQSPWGKRLHYCTSALFPPTIEVGLEKKKSESFALLVSSPERAMFEVLDGVPHAQDFEECENLMDYQVSSRPELVQALLLKCSSVKV